MEISERPLISMWSEIISKIENMKGRIQVEIENLKQELRSREREREEVWSSYWFICWIFLPLIGFIMLIVTIVKRLNKSSRLERECNELREKIRELERMEMEERLRKG